jgi:hypothetical protein
MSSFYKYCTFEIHPYNLGFTIQILGRNACAAICSFEVPSSAAMTLSAVVKWVGQKRYYDVFPSVQNVHVYWRDGMEDPERIEKSLRNIFGGDKKAFTVNFH